MKLLKLIYLQFILLGATFVYSTPLFQQSSDRWQADSLYTAENDARYEAGPELLVRTPVPLDSSSEIELIYFKTQELEPKDSSRQYVRFGLAGLRSVIMPEFWADAELPVLTETSAEIPAFQRFELPEPSAWACLAGGILLLALKKKKEKVSDTP